ncbi:MAG: hypothetical protein ASARMPREDX12_006197 [Alectoria sarmentosa]|nr:MAG: hypothetical protein ASARMPREDX12_006197 [Alectoria sarmentosa]
MPTAATTQYLDFSHQTPANFVSESDLNACLEDASNELNDELRQRGDRVLDDGYYERIVRSVAFEAKHVGGFTYSAALDAIWGLRLKMLQDGSTTLQASVFFREGVPHVFGGEVWG